jgi:predicted nucleotide-binding protein
MEQGIVLIADNLAEVRNSRKALLEREGYTVFLAANPQEARDILTNQHVDLAILDIRLENDRNEKDISGLTLAQSTAPSVPKILLTHYPSADTVRDALSPLASGGPAAIDYVAKEKGPAELLQAVQRVLMQKVFVVHGHDEGARNAVVVLLNALGLRHIVLHDQPNAGRIIIQKFEDYTNVGYAVVLLTPDDFGGCQQTPQKVQPRARQNVTLEWGYFLGKLGSRRVCALHKEGVEIPSDYVGVLLLPMDSGGEWKYKLAQEMYNAGLHVNLSKVR